MIEKSNLDKWYTEGQKARRPVKKFFEKHAHKVRAAEAKDRIRNTAMAQALNSKK